MTCPWFPHYPSKHGILKKKYSFTYPIIEAFMLAWHWSTSLLCRDPIPYLIDYILMAQFYFIDHGFQPYLILYLLNKIHFQLLYQWSSMASTYWLCHFIYLRFQPCSFCGFWPYTFPGLKLNFLLTLTLLFPCSNSMYSMGPRYVSSLGNHLCFSLVLTFLLPQS